MAHIDYLRDEADAAWRQHLNPDNPYRSAAFLRWQRCALRIERMEKLGIEVDEPDVGYAGHYVEACTSQAEREIRARKLAAAQTARGEDDARQERADQMHDRSVSAISARERL